MHNDDYFTAGELASIFGVSKQTLLYYDRIDLLKPDFVADNGYRYYSIRQYLELEIIVNLRQLDVAIPDIRQYLSHRGREPLEKLLDKKYRCCEEIIRKSRALEQSIGHVKQAMDWREKNGPSDISISWQPELYMHCDALDKGMCGKKRVVRYAKASRELLEQHIILEKRLGWVMDADSYLRKGNVIESEAFFVLYPKEEKYEEAVNHKIPAGLCCRVILQGTFYTEGAVMRDRILTFLERCRMKPREQVYVLPIKNHWYTRDWHDYVTEIFFPVVPDKE